MLKDHPYHQLLLPSKGDRPFVALNMVASLDGKITAGGAQTADLGSSFDRQTMNVIRSHFDAILTGGNTARQHPFYLGVPARYESAREKRGLCPQPLTIVLTSSGGLDPKSPLFKNPPRPPILVTSPQGALRLGKALENKARIERTAAGLNLLQLLTLLFQKYEVRSLLVEGGASVNYQFLQAGLLDWLFLTITPHLVGSRFDLTMVMGEKVFDQQPQITLLSHFARENELFLRYALDWPDFRQEAIRI